MQELFLSVRRVEMVHFVYQKFFITEKEHNFRTDENIALLHPNMKRKKKNEVI